MQKSLNCLSRFLKRRLIVLGANTVNRFVKMAQYLLITKKLKSQIAHNARSVMNRVAGALCTIL
jgi:hypothetical protein